MKNNNTKWVKPIHRIFAWIIRLTLRPVCYFKYNYTANIFKDTRKRPYFVLYTHRTVKDQFFVSLGFNRNLYFVANQDLFTSRLSPFLIKMLAPIPYKKASSDLKSMRLCQKIANEGGSIAIAPEGNITYDGTMCYVKPSIAKFIKFLKLPVAVFAIDGGYGTLPRWADNSRKGKIHGSVVRVIDVDEYVSMTNEELYNEIVKALSIDESKPDCLFKAENRANYLERLIYVCPKCGLSKFESQGNNLVCKTCGLTAEYGENKQFSGVQFNNVAEWYKYQNNFIINLNLDEYANDQPIFTDTVPFYKVIDMVGNELIDENAKIAMYKDRFTVNDEVIKLDDISVFTAIEANTFDIYVTDNLRYQFRPTDKRFNALKYVNLFYHYKYEHKQGEYQNELEFLGL